MTDTNEAPKPNRRALSKARTAELVRTVAKQLFEDPEVGYEKATIRGIAKGCGMSTGAVFANYKDKAVLYEVIYGHKPISPEKGRDAILTIRQMMAELSRGFVEDETLNDLSLILVGFPTAEEDQKRGEAA